MAGSHVSGRRVSDVHDAEPSELPVQLASKFELVVNLKTAKVLGLTISEPFLQHADEVIE